MPLVHVVDDDPEICRSLQLLLDSVAIDVKTYPSADVFLANIGQEAEDGTVLLLDVRMPGMSGLALLERLRAERVSVPVIIMTGHGDIDMAVRAMKLGAMDFITKPFSAQTLLDRIQEVLRGTSEASTPIPSADKAGAILGALTAREREIFDRIVAGEANKAIARDLGISIRTVESHRASIREKTKANSLVDLVLLAVGAKAGQY